MRYYNSETIKDITFGCGNGYGEFDADHFIGCTFVNCIFKDSDQMNIQVTKLIQSGNKLQGCWYNPTLILTKVINSLHDDVNFLDFLNKALIKSAKNRHKQLVLLDLLLEPADAKIQV